MNVFDVTFSSQDGQPVYMAIKGVVFDVTKGKGNLKSVVYER